eukprot:365028-Chlamydomonas_euryale.AAC.8
MTGTATGTVTVLLSQQVPQGSCACVTSIAAQLPPAELSRQGHHPLTLHPRQESVCMRSGGRPQSLSQERGGCVAGRREPCRALCVATVDVMMRQEGA